MALKEQSNSTEYQDELIEYITRNNLFSMALKICRNDEILFQVYNFMDSLICLIRKYQIFLEIL